MTTYLYTDIRETTQKGILLKDGTYIDFSVCIANACEHFKRETTCVAESDCMCFIFFTDPKIKIIFKTHRGLFAEHRNRNDKRRFQLLLQSMNYSTYDLT